jgi:hypothetical protein
MLRFMPLSCPAVTSTQLNNPDLTAAHLQAILGIYAARVSARHQEEVSIPDRLTSSRHLEAHSRRSMSSETQNQQHQQ